MILLFATIALLTCAAANDDDGCDTSPQIYSYHLHVLFLQNNESSVYQAMKLQKDFVTAFGLVGKPNCSGNAGDPWNKGEMILCSFGVDMEPVGPFPTAQFAFFVPPEVVVPTLNFLVQRRGDLDVLLHPNSGCEIEDHTKWMSWSGLSWRIDTSAFHCESPGCVPPS